MPWTIIQKMEWCTLQDRVIESMLPNPQTPTPADRPPPPLLIRVLLTRELVWFQFNPVNCVLDKTWIDFCAEAGLGAPVIFTTSWKEAEWVRLPEVPVTVIM